MSIRAWFEALIRVNLAKVWDKNCNSLPGRKS